MSIAVVIPIYNGEKHISETLDSVLAQTLSPEEILVVDDGSTDASASIISTYPEVGLLENPGDGPNAARNHGLRKTNAEQVAFIDHDDLWHPEHLHRLSHFLTSETDSPAAVASRTRFRDGDAPQYSVESQDVDLRNPWDDYPGNAIGEPLVALIRRDALESVDGWSTRHDGCGDYHLWLKLGLLGPLVVSESATAAYRNNVDGSVSSRLRKDNLLYYYEQHVYASHDALKLREERGLDTEVYERRSRAQAALLELLRVLLTEKDGDLQQAAKQFDRNVAGEFPEGISPMWSTFQWYVSPTVQEVGPRNFAFRLFGLVDRWPYTDSHLRSLFQEWAYNLTPATGLLLQHPWRISSFRHLLKRGYGRIRSRNSG